LHTHKGDIDLKAQAIVFREANHPALEEIEIPEIKPTEVRLRTLYSGVSIGTESSIFSGVRTHNGTFPLVGGYMTTSVVEQVGADVTGLSEGDRVVAAGGRLEGEINSVFGGHMSATVVGAEKIMALPDGADPREAALFVLLKVGFDGATMPEINAHDRVVIFGQGLIGQFCAQFARARGARVIAVEPSADRAAQSRKHAAQHVLDPGKEDVNARIDEITEGQGPTVVVEATGAASVIAQASAVMRTGNRFVFLGWHPGDVPINFHHFHAHKAVALFPMGGGDREHTRAVLDALARGTVVVGDNLTDVVPVKDACEGYRRIVEGDRSILGMVIDWSQS
jgi:2-desacetyl-2-hydroxyethyl bacteriochlorophyllide A dehydrogenase